MPSGFPRQLANEVLDQLAEDEPQAVRSRKDLQRINRIMGSAGTIARALARREAPPERMIELGAGDGTLMLRLARRFAPVWPRVHVTLLDRQDLVSAETRDGFSRVGWPVEVLRTNIEDWIAQEPVGRWDIGVANLFVHHFDARQIRALFAALRRRADMFVACEPRRGHLPLLASRMVGLLGANAVTREDAVLSVRAGFCDTELSAAWARSAPEWRLEEKPAGGFSHLFVAHRRSG